MQNNCTLQKIRRNIKIYELIDVFSEYINDTIRYNISKSVMTARA